MPQTTTEDLQYSQSFFSYIFTTMDSIRFSIITVLISTIIWLQSLFFLSWNGSSLFFKLSFFNKIHLFAKPNYYSHEHLEYKKKTAVIIRWTWGNIKQNDKSHNNRKFKMLTIKYKKKIIKIILHVEPDESKKHARRQGF